MERRLARQAGGREVPARLPSQGRLEPRHRPPAPACTNRKSGGFGRSRDEQDILLWMRSCEVDPRNHEAFVIGSMPGRSLAMRTVSRQWRTVERATGGLR